MPLDEILYANVETVKDYLADSEQTRKALVKKFEKVRNKASIHLETYNEADDSDLNTTAAAAKKTEKALKDLDAAYTALEEHVHDAEEVADDELVHSVENAKSFRGGLMKGK